MRWSSPVFRLIGIGWYFALSIVLGILTGVWLDSKATTAPLFTLIGLLLGLAVAFVGGYRMLAETVLRRNDREDR